MKLAIAVILSLTGDLSTSGRINVPNCTWLDTHETCHVDTKVKHTLTDLNVVL